MFNISTHPSAWLVEPWILKDLWKYWKHCNFARNEDNVVIFRVRTQNKQVLPHWKPFMEYCDTDVPDVCELSCFWPKTQNNGILKCEISARTRPRSSPQHSEKLFQLLWAVAVRAQPLLDQIQLTNIIVDSKFVFFRFLVALDVESGGPPLKRCGNKVVEHASKVVTALEWRKSIKNSES